VTGPWDNLPSVGGFGVALKLTSVSLARIIHMFSAVGVLFSYVIDNSQRNFVAWHVTLKIAFSASTVLNLFTDAASSAVGPGAEVLPFRAARPFATL
jgi:hypothetical protein